MLSERISAGAGAVLAVQDNEENAEKTDAKNCCPLMDDYITITYIILQLLLTGGPQRNFNVICNIILLIFY